MMKLEAVARLLASQQDELVEKIRKHAERMDRLPRGSKEYHQLQFVMQRMLKDLRKVAPDWDNSAFDPVVWSHSGKPVRQSPGLLRAGLDRESSDVERLMDAPAPTEDPLSTGVAFDMLVDGEPGDKTPVVQTVTKDDGTTQVAPEKQLLNNDLVIPSIQFARRRR